MNNTILVGFGHRARNGKDTAVAAIIEAFKDQYDVRRYSFGDGVKEEVNALDQVELCMRQGIPYDFDPPMDDPMCQTKHGKQRKLLQWYGTEFRRAQDPFYWVNKLRKKIEEEKAQVALISDMRVVSEAYYIAAFRGYTVKVTRHGFADILTPGNHKSETELLNFKFDYEISVLDGELDQLKKDAVTVFQIIADAQKFEGVPDEIVAATA